MKKILALADYYDHNSVLRALEDATESHAFSAEYIASSLQFRQNCKESAPLHIPRNCDLLDLQHKDPDLDIYDQKYSGSLSRETHNTPGKKKHPGNASGENHNNKNKE